MVEELTKHEKACLADLNRAWNNCSRPVKELFIDRLIESYDRQRDNRATGKTDKTARVKTSTARANSKDGEQTGEEGVARRIPKRHIKGSKKDADNA